MLRRTSKDHHEEHIEINPETEQWALLFTVKDFLSRGEGNLEGFKSVLVGMYFKTKA